MKLAIAALVFVLAACGQGGTGTTSSTATSATVASGPIRARVEVSSFSPECGAVKCWLPTQFGPRLVERESVSLEERTPDDPKGAQVGWPVDKDEIEVLCVIKGGQYSNTTGQTINDWYRVVIPADKVEPRSRERAERASDGVNYQAYVGISWLQLPEGKEASTCASS